MVADRRDGDCVGGTSMGSTNFMSRPLAVPASTAEARARTETTNFVAIVTEARQRERQ